MDREELAWAAGFFDGEGTLSYAQKARFVTVRVAQTERKILERFQRAVGGVGKIYGPYVQRHKDRWERKPQYAFQSGRSEHVQAVVAFLWFKLGEVKRAQAARVLQARSNTCRRGHPSRPGEAACGRCTAEYWRRRREAKAGAGGQASLLNST
jgi:hypothetical protein